MSLDILNQLESKIQQTVETIELLQLEIEDLKGKNRQLEEQAMNSSGSVTALQEENQRLKAEQQQWQDRLQSLLGRMKDIG
ncbi:cell division protein ZapB [Zophobihabitans entericus]|uniref:Cell division protein ZapB n=2 Tax=Zophobihabitans entericus TaxID=1635327 RepID=A0A6G9IBQ3_9GAMM|nr:cell division protein ZapB [Zophobihabitans entericus]QIQ21262.1 cell division protein ZapB [Zophobihabitans entericus]